MRNTENLPYIMLFISIFIGTIIGMVNNLTFVAFLERTFIFYFVIFIISKIFVLNLLNVKQNKPVLNKIDITIPAGEFNTIQNVENEDAEFIPLDYNNYNISTNSKILGDGKKS